VARKNGHSSIKHTSPRQTHDLRLLATYVIVAAKKVESNYDCATVCHPDQNAGHWIQDCPTNDNRDYDNRPRLKRTTGIPRSFLKTVDAPTEGGVAAGVMITPDGGYVVAQPDS
jgi:hypothetical protein